MSDKPGIPPEVAATVRHATQRAFALAGDLVHLNAMFLASPPASVRLKVEAHRDGFAADPTGYFFDEVRPRVSRAVEESNRAANAAAAYLGLTPDEKDPEWGSRYVAQTDSTTMGLATLANGIRARPRQRVLASAHDYIAMHESWEARCVAEQLEFDKTIMLYRDPATCGADEILENVDRALCGDTRVLSLTWVHSNTGVKLPIRAIADRVAAANLGRAVDDRILFMVDGVHGFGVEEESFEDLGCDFFVAGSHKWIFGPRGTGIICGRAEAWDEVVPTIPTAMPMETLGAIHSPGGVKPYEHAWAVPEAYKFLLDIGKSNVRRYTHGLASRLKAGLRDVPGVEVVTPMDPALSSGIVCCDVDGREPGPLVRELRRSFRIVAGRSSPDAFGRSHLRFSPSILNSTADVDAAIEAVRTLAR